ncbi:10423_t:CDS:2 [Gigaspora margarita]|uniref:10423_t:CDS:1 n=1 Tax=Gigaspora margarita TaxID=4874 RepID=A0ABN7VP31_GIGMA|nr:10423_t:CDS:2 [Gigaspora margarita]
MNCECYEHRDSHNCKGRAATILEGQIHILKKFSEHNHAPEPSRVDVIQALNNIKELASQTCKKLFQIIHNATIDIPEDSFYYMPNTREIDIDNEKIMIFCTSNNLLYLEEVNYWLMDGTFKTVPTLFRQLYTIHTPVGGEKLLNLSKEADYNLSPFVITTNFEQSVINAIQSKFPNSTHKGCYFHFCQNLWKKIQAEELAIEYDSNEAFIYELVENEFSRTQNLVEGWHNRWNNIVEKMHLGTYTIIEKMHKEQQVDMQIERVLYSEPCPTQQKCLINHEKRILSVFNNCDTYTLVDFLRDIAHNISL